MIHEAESNEELRRAAAGAQVDIGGLELQRVGEERMRRFLGGVFGRGRRGGAAVRRQEHQQDGSASHGRRSRRARA